MTVAYYNEIDPYAAEWLRNLIAAGHIAPGDVDTRSIEDVKPADLIGYTQCHFFAGIGVWSYALRQSGWLDCRPVWTGSCPCQPFSDAGQGNGFSDKRHLWPSWYHLITQLCPSVIIGEQVASKAADAWVDLVHADLEAMDYAFGCIAFPSAGVGAPHIRDRTYWVADTAGDRWGWERSSTEIQAGRTARPDERGVISSGFERRGISDIQPATLRQTGGMRPSGAVNGYWQDADWLKCRDGKWRPVESGTFPLANGIANRVGRLRAYGNAINAQAAITFIESYMECRP